MIKELQIYQTRDGKEPLLQWLLSLKDRTIRDRIRARIDRLRFGNLGDHKRFAGLIELRIHVGKGYRVYCAEDEEVLIVLLVGGDKSTQDKDINLALEYWRDYHDQKKI